MLKQNFEETGIDELELHTKMKRKDFFGKVGLTDPEKMRQYEHKKSKIMFDS